MSAIEHQDTDHYGELDDSVKAEIRERLLEVCEAAGDAEPAARRQELRGRLSEASRNRLDLAVQKP